MLEGGVRLHDAQYLRLDRYDEPLEIFKMCGNALASDKSVSLDVLDVGCAAGEFLHHLKNRYPENLYSGLDVLPELVERANEKLGGGVSVGSVFDKNAVNGKNFDRVFMLNAHMIFDDLTEVLSNLVSWCRPGGKLILAGAFNPDPADVWIRYRRVDDSDIAKSGELETGWNIHSLASVGKLIDKLVGVERYAVVPFDLPVDIEKDPDDFLRQRTIKAEDGKRWIVNGLSQLVQIYVFVVDIPDKI